MFVDCDRLDFGEVSQSQQELGIHKKKRLLDESSEAQIRATNPNM